MNENQQDVCLNCRWWKPWEYAQMTTGVHPVTKGSCRFGPPSVVQMGNSDLGFRAETFWPETIGADFCSKFEISPDRLDSARSEP